MANIGSKQVGGNYPMPAEWRDYVWRLFKPFDASKGKRAIIYDPFANTGEMLLRGADMLNLEPYAVELQDQFIAQGRENMARHYLSHKMNDLSLTRFLNDDSFRVEMSHGSASIVYCNSPFDDLLVSNADTHSVGNFGAYGGLKQRYELTALKHNFKYVAPNGYMVWIAYAQHMTRKVIKTFRENCDNIIAFRFPEEHLDHYTLVCVVGNYIKGHEKIADLDPRALEIENWFIDLGKHPEKITDISKVYDVLTKTGKYLFPGVVGGVQYPPIPALTIYRGSVWFQSDDVDSTATDSLNAKYGAQNIRSFLSAVQPTEEPPLERPLHRPNKRQMIINIASGMLDNLELKRDGRRCLLRGSVRELYQLIGKEEEQVTNKDETFTRIHETTIIRPDQHIVLLYEDGEIEDLSGSDSLKELIENNSDLLISHFSVKYKPFYDMTIHPTWKKLLDCIHPGGLPTSKFFRAQRYVAICSIENLAINRRQITNAQQGFGKTALAGVSMLGLRLLEVAKKWKPGTPLPKIALRFGLTGDDLTSLLDNLRQRYGDQVDDMMGIPVNQPCVVSVPAIAPSIWLKQEITPLYSGFKVRQLSTATDADEFMKEARINVDDDIIYLGVITYESAKSNEGREPVAVPRYSRGTHWEQGQNGAPRRVIDTLKRPSDPVTGSIIVDRKGEEVPWMRFTKEKRGKELAFFSGRTFYGYGSDVVVLPDGKREVRINREKQLFSIIVPRKLTKDEVEINRTAGYPRLISRQYPLYSEIRNFGKPKIGNGHTVTPMIEKHYPQKIIQQIKFHRDGYRCAPYITDVIVHAYTIKVPDFENQKNLIPNEEILDPWLAWKGTRYTEDRGRKDKLDKAMRLARLNHYRVGDGNKELDALLTKDGLFQYTIGVGERSVKNPRYPLANYFRRFYEGQIAMFIADELHLVKSNTTEIGASFRDLALAANIVNGLTGTLYGGKSTSVYSLAYAFDPNIRKRYPWTRGAPMKWVEDMGVRKMVEIRDVGSSSLRSGKRQAPRITEAPGASPLLQRALSPYTLWASLQDMGNKMPDKAELSYHVTADRDQDALRNIVYTTTRDYNAKLIVGGDRSYLAGFYQTNVSLMDAMHRSGVSIHNVRMDKGAARAKYAEIQPVIVMNIPSLGPALKAKEREALEWLKKDLANDRRVIITMCQTESRDIRDRWFDIIRENVPGARPFILKSSVKASERSSYIKKMANEGFNVMITNGGLITTAISITNFSAMYAIEYATSLYSFAQYCARINRPNQERDDIVYRFFYYGDDKFQRNAIESIADKTKAAAVLAGAEGGDLASLMSSEERVQSYTALLDAIEKGRNKPKTAAEIQAAFDTASYSSQDWASSAWYQVGDEDEDKDSFYAESEVEEMIDEEEPVLEGIDEDLLL